MAWLGRSSRPPRKSVGGHENSLRDAMRSRGGITIRPPAAPTDVEDNEPVPEKSTLDWLNLNAFAPKAIQGAIDRIRLSTVTGAGDAEVPKEAEGELLTSPRRMGNDQPTSSTDGYVRPARKSLSSALRARGGITRPSVAETEPDAPALDEPDEPAAATVDEADEAESLDSSAADVEAASAQPSADRTASAPLPLPVLHEEEEPVTLSVQSTERPENSAAESPAHSAAESPAHSAGAEHPEHSASGDAEQTGEEAADAGPEEVEEIPDRQDEPAELEAPSEEPERTQADSVQDTAQDPAPRCPSGPDDASKDSEEPRKPKDHQDSTWIPMPTPLMAATASARRAPPVVVAPQPEEAPKPEEASHEPAGKPLLAPEPHLRVQTRDVGKLKELREFWGNKSSKGFAGPGLTGSRLSKNEAQATLQRLLIAGGDFDEVRKLRKIIAELESA
ncbi:rlmN [Symbiodinium natans]|uniref:RlmN protein n=1 Tax=Symbiodinium natans TaxID=878477 RepID=A0A812LME7_9DINO|nr:rlmN [Symbiodinium natans]